MKLLKLVSLNPDKYKSISVNQAVKQYADWFHYCKSNGDREVKDFTQWLETEI